ncbi:MAG TPA: ATP-binding cassette domain-containing protein [Kofleriaceae bacterium]|nr:ATP-binding cassette domain-containing protein [Kofleriaceae bacterium]
MKALSKVSFEVGKGEVIGLLGPNGAGKTTLMKVLTGYLQPDGGTASVAGVDVVADPLEAQRRIGYLPENAPLYGEMAVQEYLTMMARLRGVPVAKHKRLISEAVYATGLEEYLTRPIGKLSKGYRQRVGVAQAILHQPELLILDEPTTGLDPTQIAEIRDLIRELAESSTIMLSTHILPEVEMTCDRVLMIIGGQLRADANLVDLRASNAAVVAIKDKTAGVREALEGLAGVKQVEELDLDAEGYRRWRVSTAADANPCPEIFEVVRAKDWMISELRVAPRTLESVFRDLAEQEAA